MITCDVFGCDVFRRINEIDVLWADDDGDDDIIDDKFEDSDDDSDDNITAPVP